MRIYGGKDVGNEGKGTGYIQLAVKLIIQREFGIIAVPAFEKPNGLQFQ